MNEKHEESYALTDGECKKMNGVQDLGRIEGLDDYIEKQLAEKQKIIDKQKATISALKEENNELKKEKAELTEKLKECYMRLYRFTCR